jgi:tRNA-2-methylthio-N6-dimethylallyladenosine synthase
MIGEVKRTGRAVVDVSFPEIEKFDHLPAPRAQGASAYVSVMEGCSKYCSFCIVPYTRGDEVNRPFEAVLAEVRELAAQGVREVTLLGQNVNAYAGRTRGRSGRRPCNAHPLHRGAAGHRAHPLHDLASARVHAEPH